MRIDDEKKPTGSRCGCTTAPRPTTATRPSPKLAKPYLLPSRVAVSSGPAFEHRIGTTRTATV